MLILTTAPKPMPPPRLTPRQVAMVRCEQGNALMQQKKPDEAVSCYRLACELSPDSAEFHSNLGVALEQAGRLRDAVIALLQAIRLNPKLAGAHANLGLVLQKQGNVDAAIACFRRAIALQPGLAEAHSNLGCALLERGAVEDAGAAFEAATTLAPRQGVFARMLASTGRVAAGSRAFRRMEALAGELGSLGEDDRLELHFALGAMYADNRQPQKSLAHLRQGNQLQRRRIAYDETRTLALFERISSTFSAAMREADRPPAADQVRPIFVVGMPRSGTSLVEQILASHPEVYGAGEVTELPNLTGLMLQTYGADPYPDGLVGLPQEALAQLRRAYLDALRRRAAPAMHVVDKLPDNFLRIGLIHLAMPDARIIHLQRDPLDTCLSCYSKLFTGDQPYSYDLAELGRYYRAYHGLMAHWREVLPTGAMLEIRYEQLVADLAGQVRRILSYCGLPWNESCLAFHRTSRRVQTASAAQVRQPLYDHAVGRWQACAALAQPLTDILATLRA